MDIFNGDKSSSGFRIDSHLRLLEEIQLNARASRSTRYFGGLIRNVHQSFANLRKQIGARRVMKVDLTHRIRVKNTKPKR